MDPITTISDIAVAIRSQIDSSAARRARPKPKRGVSKDVGHAGAPCSWLTPLSSIRMTSVLVRVQKQ
jgi:hypothetical protein